MAGVAPPAATTQLEPGSASPGGINSDQLPAVATNKAEVKQKIAEISNNRQGAVKGVGKSSELVDKAVATMKNTWVKLDEKVSDDSCLKRITRALRDFEDPVKSARCSIGRLMFLGVTLWGAVFVIIEAALYDSIADLGAGLMMFALGLFATICLGGDLFMFDAFRRIVDGLAWQIEILKASRKFYARKLDDLTDVAEGLEEVTKQMSGDIEATTTLLSDMERLGKLRTVTSVVNMFHNADYDGSGRIHGEAAQLLLPNLEILWQIVPGYDKAKVTEYVSNNGITLKQFYPIIDALVMENEAMAFRALEELVGESASTIAETLVEVEADMPGVPEALAEDAEAQEKPSAQLETAVAHSCAPPLPPIVDEAVCDLDLDNVDIEAAASPVPRRIRESVHSMAPPTPSSSIGAGREKQSSRGTIDSSKAPETMKPLFILPTPLPKRKVWGIIEIGGSFSIWGIWHLGALICVPFALVILIVCIADEGEIHNVIMALCVFLFTVALTGTGKLVEIVKALRKQLAEFTSENLKLRDLNDGLAIQVAKLQKLKDGWIQLRTVCGGNVDKAKEILAKSHMKSKMEAVGVVNRLFRMNDDERNFKLTEEQKEEFFVDLTKLFHHLPGFNVEKIREIVGPGEMGHQKIHEIVNVIVSYEMVTTRG